MSLARLAVVVAASTLAACAVNPDEGSAKEDPAASKSQAYEWWRYYFPAWSFQKCDNGTYDTADDRAPTYYYVRRSSCDTIAGSNGNWYPFAVFGSGAQMCSYWWHSSRDAPPDWWALDAAAEYTPVARVQDEGSSPDTMRRDVRPDCRAVTTGCTISWFVGRGRCDLVAAAPHTSTGTESKGMNPCGSCGRTWYDPTAERVVLAVTLPEWIAKYNDSMTYLIDTGFVDSKGQPIRAKFDAPADASSLRVDLSMSGVPYVKAGMQMKISQIPRIR